MKVLIVTKTKSGGGTEKHVSEISKAIGADIAYLEDGFWALYRRIRNGDYNWVHFFLPRPYVLGSLACDLAFQHNRIMSRRSLTDSYQTPLIRFIEKLLHKRTKILVGNSPAIIEQLKMEAPKTDIRLIRNGVTIKPFPRVRPDGLFRMICVANAFSYKGIDDLLSAMRKVYGLPEPWRLFIAGRDTDKIKEWRVYGLGYCTHIPELLSNADLFILPSHEEGSSNALLEAMACGVPVIATDVGGNKDAITHGETGYLVPPRNPTALAAAITWMAERPNRRKEMARKAQLDVQQRFSFDRCVNDYKALYSSAA